MRALFVHIPRTGGTSIEVAIRASGLRVAPGYSESRSLMRGLDHDIWVGHHFAWFADLIQPEITFTVLREPVARVASLWGFMRAEKPDVAAGYSDLMDAVRKRTDMQNHMTRYLGAQPEGEFTRASLLRLRECPITDEVRSRAADRLHAMSVVGFTEHIDDVAAKIGVLLQRSLLPLSRAKQAPPVELTELEAEEIATLNVDDANFYASANRGQ